MGDPSQSPGTNPETNPLVKQAHGGSLKRGGDHIRTGRPPNRIRAQCRRDFDEVRPLLKLFARGDLAAIKKKSRGKKGAKPSADDAEELTEIRIADRIRAIEALGKFGMDASVSMSDVRACLVETRRELEEVLPKDQFDMLWNRILGHWTKL